MKKYKLTKVMTALVLIAPSMFAFALPVKAEENQEELLKQPEAESQNLNYQLNNYYDASGVNGIVFSKNSNLLLGETISFSATVAVDYQLVSLMIGNVENYYYDAQSKTGSFTLTAQQPNVTVNFEKLEVTANEEATDIPEEVPAEENTVEPETPNEVPAETPESTIPPESEAATETPTVEEPAKSDDATIGSKEETTTPDVTAETKPAEVQASTETKTTTTTVKQEAAPLLDFVSPTQSQAGQQAIIAEALKHIGVAYVWGGKTPQGFDCSGFTQYVFNQALCLNIGGWTGEQQNIGLHKPVAQAQPGDLLFWQDSDSNYSHHVAIYLGNNQYIAAPTFGQTVKISTFSAGFMPNYAISVLGGVAGNSVDTTWSSEFTVTKNQTTSEFIAEIAEDAREIAQENDLYASVMIAQAILESGSGNSTLSAEPNFNLFGIKGQYQGAAVAMKTLEQSLEGQIYQITADFRQYPSYKESLLDYAELLKNGLESDADFYQSTWKTTTNSYTDATAFLQGRYATDQNYALKLNAIIEAYQLTDYDQPLETEIVEEVVTPQKIQRQKVSFKKLFSQFLATSKKLIRGQEDPQTIKLSTKIVQLANNETEVHYQLPNEN
ncbi:C40 family peptidase [Enterococcus sp. LJL90]